MTGSAQENPPTAGLAIQPNLPVLMSNQQHADTVVSLFPVQNSQPRLSGLPGNTFSALLRPQPHLLTHQNEPHDRPPTSQPRHGGLHAPPTPWNPIEQS